MRSHIRVLAVGIVAASLVLGAVSAPAATNLLANGAFEGTGAGSLTGWAGSGGSLALTTGDGGGHAARLAASGTAQAYIYTTTKPVRSVTVGGVYIGGGRLFSASSGQNVCLVIKEVPSGGTATVGSTRQCLTATATWQTFPAVSYTAKTSGDSLTINLLDTAPSAGASFAVDNLTLVSGSGGGGGGDTSAPSVPQGMTASATGSSTVRVGWSPSTDNVGVTGYHVYRSGISVATLGGAATSFQDSGLAPSTQYTYTVDAFDAAGNTSAQSAGAVITTPAGGGGGSSPCGTVAPSTAPYDHIVVLMDENLTYSDFISATDDPYMRSLTTNCRFETNSAGETHPSFPNYEAVTSGQFSTCLGCPTAADNLFHQLGAAGKTWRGYNQSMPSNCATNISKVSYYRDGHNPAFWYTDPRTGRLGRRRIVRDQRHPARPGILECGRCGQPAQLLMGLPGRLPRPALDERRVRERRPRRDEGRPHKDRRRVREQHLLGHRRYPKLPGGQDAPRAHLRRVQLPLDPGQGQLGHRLLEPRRLCRKHPDVPGRHDPRVGPHHAGRDVGLLQPLQPWCCHRAELRPATAGTRGISHTRADLLT